MKKKAFLSFEEDLIHHKEFIRHFEKRIEPIILRSKEKFLLNEQLSVFDKMYDWTVKHLLKFQDSAYELTIELLTNYVEKQKEHGQETTVTMEITEILFLQMFIKLHNFFETKAKQDHLQNTIMYMLAKKLIRFEVKNNEELVCALLALMTTQDILRKTPYFFPEVIICLERVLFCFTVQIQERKLTFTTQLLDPTNKTVDKSHFVTVCKYILEGTTDLNGVSVEATLYKTIDKLMGSYLILFGSDPNCDITLANLWNYVQGIKEPVVKAFSESTFNKLKNLVEYTSEKSDMNIIKDKPLIRVKQLTPKFDDSDEENQKDYEEELAKERKVLKKAVNRESKRAMKELAYDSMVLQMEKDKEKDVHYAKQKGSFKRFAKFMEEQKLEEKRIKSTQLQHKTRHKVKKVRMAGNKTDPRSGGN